MNTTKFFKKSHLAIFLSLIIITTSCSQYDNDFDEVSERIDLQIFVKRHIEISDKIITLLKNEKNIKVEALQNAPKNLTIDQINIILENANVKEHDVISELINQIYFNSFKFIESNSDFRKFNDGEIANILKTEIDKQLFQTNFNRSLHNCDRTYEGAVNNCNRSYYFSLAAVAFSGFISFGITTVIGTAFATASLVVCLEGARGDYYDCLAE